MVPLGRPGLVPVDLGRDDVTGRTDPVGNEVLRLPMRFEAVLVGPLFEDVERHGVYEIGRHHVVPAPGLLPGCLDQMEVLLQYLIPPGRVQMERAERRDHVAKSTCARLADTTRRPHVRRMVKTSRVIEVPGEEDDAKGLILSTARIARKE